MNKTSEHVSPETVKRPNSYSASSYSQTNSNINSPNSEEDPKHSFGTATENTDGSHRQTYQASDSKGLQSQSTEKDTSKVQPGEHSKNKLLRAHDNKQGTNGTGHDKVSLITRKPSSFHGAVQSKTTSTLSRFNNVSIPRERRASCYAGSIDDVSTADLFSEHRDDSGFPRLSWKGEHSDPDLNIQGKSLH